jgi:hypothetical protein
VSAHPRVLERVGGLMMGGRFVVHQEINDGEEEVEWIVHRSGSKPIVENMPEGWGK